MKLTLTIKPMFNFETPKIKGPAEISGELIDNFLESHQGPLKNGSLGILKHDLESAIIEEVNKVANLNGEEAASKLAKYILDDLNYYKEFISAHDDEEIKSAAKIFLETYLSNQELLEAA
jgi:hypothetical protein